MDWWGDEDIERIAQAARDHWGLGSKPIDNMVVLLERIGVIVGSEPMETDRLDAISRWSADGRPYVLLADDKQSYVRRQFDCAHELAHLLLHRVVSEHEFVENFKLIEGRADRFASAFLLPAAQFPLEVERATLWELERLKLRWRVSIKAQIYRLRKRPMGPLRGRRPIRSIAGARDRPPEAGAFSVGYPKCLSN